MTDKNENNDEMFEADSVLNDCDRQDETDGASFGAEDDILADAAEIVDAVEAETAAEVAEEEKACDHDPDTLEALARERADFMNFRKRSQAEQLRSRSLGKQDALRTLLPVADEIGRAREAGDLEEGTPFANIAAKFDDALEKLGVTKYGAKGDIFDPNLHEALMNREPAEGENLKDGEILVDRVVEPGYLIGDEQFRAAKVTTVS
jgi:molecular chaperone GrpE